MKLQFTDTTGKVACVSRTLQTIQKLKTCTTKTLDGTIRRVGRDGKVYGLRGGLKELLTFKQPPGILDFTSNNVSLLHITSQFTPHRI